jgi:hypothetical protein
VIGIVAIGGWLVATRLGWFRPWVAGVVAGTTAASPLLGVSAGAVLLARARWRRARFRRDEDARADADVALLADLLVLGMTAGMSLRAAMIAAEPHVHAGLRADLEELRARFDREGMAAALVGMGGRLEDLSRIAAGAAVSGAPLGTAITAFARARRHADHAARMEAARRLPVRLLLPLALLILPGFVLLSVGPAVLEGLARLGPIP